MSTAVSSVFLLFLPFRLRELHWSRHRILPAVQARVKLVRSTISCSDRR